MKRLFSANVIILTLLLTVSCASSSLTERTVREAESLPIEERAERYENALRRDDSLPIFYNLVLTLIEQGELREADGWLSIAIANHPSSVRLYDARLYIARETEDRELAMKTLEKVVTRWPGDEEYTRMWLRALRETHDERALPEAEKAIERFPSMQEAINILADSDAFYETKRKITPFDFEKLDLPSTYIWNTIENTLIRTWRSLSE